MSDLAFLVPRSHLLNANSRGHWATKARKTRALRTIANINALNHRRAPFTGPVHVVVAYTFPDARRRDHSNLAPTTKALTDGLTDAGWWPDDSTEYVIGPDTRIADPDRDLPAGQVRVTITTQEHPC